MRDAKIRERGNGRKRTPSPPGVDTASEGGNEETVEKEKMEAEAKAKAEESSPSARLPPGLRTVLGRESKQEEKSEKR
jgi:hypothetical protein